MADKYDMGTPVGGERKCRRMHSPLEEMDDIQRVLDLDDDVEEQVPTTPVEAFRAPPPSSPVSAPSVNLLSQIAGLLDEKLAPITSTIKDMQFDVVRIDSNVERVSNELRDLSSSLSTRMKMAEDTMKDITVRVAKLEEVLPSTGTSVENVPSWLTDKLREVEAALKNLHARGFEFSHPVGADDRSRTAVIGGLSSTGSFEAATSWVTDQLWKQYGPVPTSVFKKGEFNGIVFAKFANESDRNDAVAMLKEEDDIWAKADRPLKCRMLRSLLFGTKYIMNKEWGWDIKSLWADPEEGSLSADDSCVFNVSLSDTKFEIQYGPGWEEYLTDKNYPQVMELIKSVNSKLAKGGGKGKQKGGKADA